MSKKDPKQARTGDEGPANVRRDARFPGDPKSGKEAVLRLAIDRKPIADLLSHGGSSAEVEVCGVLVGYIGEDSNGQFVHVLESIRGEQAREQGAHVTFTHETWNHIHKVMDSAYSDMQILGWYHTHPGFGVFLSEMDAFIHQNFFGQPHQVALVYDPLAGKTAVFTLRGTSLVPLPSYWRDGREVILDVSAQPGSQQPVAGSSAEELASIRDAVVRVERAVREPRPRSWLEDWLVPLLIMGVLALQSFQLFFPTRSENPVVRDMAMLYLTLVDQVRTGDIRIVDRFGRRVELPDPATTSRVAPLQKAPGSGEGSWNAPGQPPASPGAPAPQAAPASPSPQKGSDGRSKP